MRAFCSAMNLVLFDASGAKATSRQWKLWWLASSGRARERAKRAVLLGGHEVAAPVHGTAAHVRRAVLEAIRYAPPLASAATSWSTLPRDGAGRRQYIY